MAEAGGEEEGEVEVVAEGVEVAEVHEVVGALDAKSLGATVSQFVIDRTSVCKIFKFLQISFNHTFDCVNSSQNQVHLSFVIYDHFCLNSLFCASYILYSLHI